MKALVMSDTHGSKELIKEVIKRHENEVDMIFHLGDIQSDISFYDKKIVYSIPGNTDGCFRTSEDYEKIVEVDGKRILLTHSDHLQTHFSLARLRFRAEELRVDICLFGHTHKRFLDDTKCPILFNPGALTYSNITPPSYGIMKIEGEKIIFKHYALKANEHF